VFFNLFAAAEPHTSVKSDLHTSRNPMHWSISLAMYERLKLQGVYRLISLAGQRPHGMTKKAKMTNY